jgi:transposase
VPREHKRAKTDRLDTEMLMRALLGWLRGEPRHCRMAQIPTLAEEDARQPNREHKTLVSEQTSLVNRMKSTLVKLGIANFDIKLVKAGQKLAGLRSPNGEPIPPNTLAALYRGLERLALIRKQIKAIEQELRQRLKAKPEEAANPQILMLGQIHGHGLETADLLVHEVLMRNLRDQRAVGRYGASPGRRTRAARAGASRASPRPATGGSVTVRCSWRGAGSSSRRTAPWRNGILPAPLAVGTSSARR